MTSPDSIIPIDLDEAVDEQHAAVLSVLPPDLMDMSDVPAARERLAALLAMMPMPPMPDDVEVSEQMVTGHEGDPDVRLKIYRPVGLAARLPAMYWIHGGGMVLMDADGDDLACAMTAARHGCLVVSVDYRLAPETPAPGPVHDCYAGLAWLAANADDLGIDPARILIGGASAGAGLAAGTALLARDLGGPVVAGQLLRYPMLDHRNETASSYAITDQRVWNRSGNVAAWAAYLGGAAPTPYSSPTTADDLSGLPPAYINVGTLDMFMDEDIAYAQELNRAGVPCELHVYPGAFHASNGFVADHPTSVRWAADEAAFVESIFGA